MVQGQGLVFVPLSTIAFATLARDYRTDATALFRLTRNMQVNHVELDANISACNGGLRGTMPGAATGARPNSGCSSSWSVSRR